MALVHLAVRMIVTFYRTTCYKTHRTLVTESPGASCRPHTLYSVVAASPRDYSIILCPEEEE